MSDRFEKRLRDWRDKPLPAAPSEASWAAIQRRLHPVDERPKPATWQRYSWLLSLLLLTTCGTWAYRVHQPRPIAAIHSATAVVPVSTPSTPPEVDDTEELTATSPSETEAVNQRVAAQWAVATDLSTSAPPMRKRGRNEFSTAPDKEVPAITRSSLVEHSVSLVGSPPATPSASSTGRQIVPATEGEYFPSADPSRVVPDKLPRSAARQPAAASTLTLPDPPSSPVSATAVDTTVVDERRPAKGATTRRSKTNSGSLTGTVPRPPPARPDTMDRRPLDATFLRQLRRRPRSLPPAGTVDSSRTAQANYGVGVGLGNARTPSRPPPRTAGRALSRWSVALHYGWLTGEERIGRAHTELPGSTPLLPATTRSLYAPSGEVLNFTQGSRVVRGRTDRQEFGAAVDYQLPGPWPAVGLQVGHFVTNNVRTNQNIAEATRGSIAFREVLRRERWLLGLQASYGIGLFADRISAGIGAGLHTSLTAKESYQEYVVSATRFLDFPLRNGPETTASSTNQSLGLFPSLRIELGVQFTPEALLAFRWHRIRIDGDDYNSAGMLLRYRLPARGR